MDDLNIEQIKCLFNDILIQDVKKYGQYKFGHIIITISQFEEKRKELRGMRKESGICIDCGRKKATLKTFTCQDCRKKHNKWRVNKKMKLRGKQNEQRISRTYNRSG